MHLCIVILYFPGLFWDNGALPDHHNVDACRGFVDPVLVYRLLVLRWHDPQVVGVFSLSPSRYGLLARPEYQ